MPTAYHARWPVRVYELDANGHVNNAVYLNWAEEVATQHAEVSGFGAEWAQRNGGAWVVRRHEITYHRSARYGDEVDLATRVLEVRGARGLRRTEVCRVSDGELLAELLTEWVWVRLSDFRPTRVPPEVAAAMQAEG